MARRRQSNSGSDDSEYSDEDNRSSEDETSESENESEPESSDSGVDSDIESESDSDDDSEKKKVSLNKDDAVKLTKEEWERATILSSKDLDFVSDGGDGPSESSSDDEIGELEDVGTMDPDGDTFFVPQSINTTVRGGQLIDGKSKDVRVTKYIIQKNRKSELTVDCKCLKGGLLENRDPSCKICKGCGFVVNAEYVTKVRRNFHFMLPLTYGEGDTLVCRGRGHYVPRRVRPAGSRHCHSNIEVRAKVVDDDYPTTDEEYYQDCEFPYNFITLPKSTEVEQKKE